MSANATNPVRGFQDNVTNLEGIRTSAEGVRVSLQAQLRQDQEAMIATITSVFQTALAASEARHQTAMDGLRAENTVLQRKVTALEIKTVKLETDLAAKVDQSSLSVEF